MADPDVETLRAVPVEFSFWLYQGQGSVNLPSELRKRLLEGLADKKIEVRIKAVAFVVRRSGTRGAGLPPPVFPTASTPTAPPPPPPAPGG